jgi:hypothetical protein
LAVFPSGNILVVGLQVRKYGDRLNQPFTAIYDSEGRISSIVRLPQDVFPVESTISRKFEPGRKPMSGKADPPASSGSVPDPQADAIRAVELGGAAVDEGGDAYILRNSPTPIVHVLTSAGQVVRRVLIPAPSGQARPATFQISRGKVAVMFQESDGDTKAKPSHLLVIVDAQTGVRIRTYRSTPELGGAFACYIGGRYFTFLGGRSGTFTILRARGEE